MISSVLVGRGSERASIDAAYQRARQGQAVTVLVSGEAGIGKSRLVTTVTADLPGEPLLLTGCCLEVGATAAPYVPFVAILRDLVRQLGRSGVDALLPLDGSALAAWLPDLTPAPGGRTRLLEELLTLVSRAAASRPVVLVVEDLHWADASSREVFVYLARNLTDRAVLLLATVRTGELASGHPGRQLLAELGRRGDVVRVALPPLGRPHVAELLAAIGGRTPDPVRSSLIHRRSGGNPLFVEALPATEDFEGNLRTLLLDRIAALPAQAQSLLPVIAVAGTIVSDEQLLAVGELPEDDLHSALRTLVDHEQLVVRDDGYAIRHDLIREAVYKTLLPHDRRRLHERYAQTVVDPAALAEHWTAAGRPVLALPAALQAADQARRQYAYDEELNLLERALDLWPRVPAAEWLTSTDHVSVHERAAAASYAAGNSATGMTHSTAAIAGLDPSVEPVRVARLLELRGRMRNRIDAGGRVDVEAAIALVPPGAADDVRGELLAALAFVAATDGDFDTCRRAAAEALRLGSARGPVLLALGFTENACGNVQRASELYAQSRQEAEAGGDHHTYLTSMQWQAVSIGTAGDFEAAAELAKAGQRAAERFGQGRSRGTVLAGCRAWALAQLGRWDEAIEVAEEALADDPPALYAAALRSEPAMIALRRGDQDRFADLAGRMEDFADHHLGMPEIVSAVGNVAISGSMERGDLDRADQLVGNFLATPPADWLLSSDGMWVILAAARTQRARLAAQPRSPQVRADVAARLRALRSLVAEISARPAVTAAQLVTFQALAGNESLKEWDAAVAAWRALGNPYELALALTAGAAAALATSGRSGARLRLREARTIAVDLRAAPLLSRIDDLAVRARLDEQQEPAGADFGLTRRELQVLRVLAEGHSNAKIAVELFISTNTVASHVQRILTKLGAGTRTEAVALAHRHALLANTPNSPGRN